VARALPLMDPLPGHTETVSTLQDGGRGGRGLDPSGHRSRLSAELGPAARLGPVLRPPAWVETALAESCMLESEKVVAGRDA
jgi:hypothetical protein